MSRLHTGSVSRPRFESAPYRQSPGRREHVHGRIRPANDNSFRRERIRYALELLVMVIAAAAIGAMLAVGHS